MSRSPLDPIEDERIVEISADDASGLLRATGTQPAFVFGSSGGAGIALELVTRHPEQREVLGR